jgi:16S rRNA (adenine1518-N6/adenine1519-N6)-dimethyltransferase
VTLPQTREQVQSVLGTLGMSPRRQSGQHFLIDSEAARDIARAAELKQNEPVLEIGPGLGRVTSALVETGAKVTAIELDRRLTPFLSANLPNERVTVITGDVFRVRLDEIFQDREYVLVSNLPYNITSLVIRNFLTLKPRPNRSALVMQKEVAERITAQPGEMSLLSVAAQLFAEVKIIRDIAPKSFWPVPEVTSSLVLFRLREGEIDENEEKNVFRIAKVGFSARRKHLARNLANGLQREHDELVTMLGKLGLPPLVRAQELSVQQWIALAKQL